jgi:hypothetical protein
MTDQAIVCKKMIDKPNGERVISYECECGGTPEFYAVSPLKPDVEPTDFAGRCSGCSNRFFHLEKS